MVSDARARGWMLSLAGGMLIGAAGVLVEGVPAGGGAPLVIATELKEAEQRRTPAALDRDEEQIGEPHREISDGGEE